MDVDAEYEDGIAVVGLAGRFPAAPDVTALWCNLLDGVDAVHDHTDEDLRALGVDETLIADPTLVRGHGRLAGAADFDAEFFAVPDAEAAAMDPQQRLFLEQSWVALQDAGVDPTRDERAVGVFAGTSANRYFLRRLATLGPAEFDRALVPGWAPDYLPAQVAYRLGLTGPAIAVQTACSSSLVAVCTAAQSLLDFRCDLAVAGGVSLTDPTFRTGQDGTVAPDGRCRAFAEDADGSGYGSGVAVLVLARLADALDRGDQVYAVLRGWAVNNDGAARAGFTAPGPAGQSAVVTEALAAAAVAPDEVGYVEAHGSGTSVGDAIEVAALEEAYRRAGGAPLGGCALGAVKSNLGNLDAAAGATALIKAVLAVRHGAIPANLHHDVPNPRLNLPATPFFVPVKNVDWTGRRVAGVSSFGLGGTNAHVIVEQPPERPARPRPGPVVLPVSARDPEALRVFAGQLAERLTEPGTRLDDVAHTLANRPAYDCRVAVVAADPTAAAGVLIGVTGESAVLGSGDAEAMGRAAEWVEGGECAVPGGQVVSLPPHPLRPRRHWLEEIP